MIVIKSKGLSGAEKKRLNAAPRTGCGAPDSRYSIPCPKPPLVGSVEKEIKETMELIIKRIQKQCDLPGNSARDIYLLSLALKEMKLAIEGNAYVLNLLWEQVAKRTGGRSEENDG